MRTYMITIITRALLLKVTYFHTYSDPHAIYINFLLSSFLLRPHVLLILSAASHRLDHLLGLGLADPPLLGNDLDEFVVHVPGHISRVAADVEVGFVALQQLVNQLAVFFEPVLHVNLFLRVFS